MNFLKTILIFIVCLISLKCLAGNHQSQNIGDSSETMLKEFYTAYNIAWSTTKGNILIKKLDSLQSKYCTISYRKKLKEEFKEVGLDHDELINDAATDIKHLNTLKISKDLKDPNEYIVSYIVFGADVSKNPLTEKIVLHILVIREKRMYRIAAVKYASYTIIPNK